MKEFDDAGFGTLMVPTDCQLARGREGTVRDGGDYERREAKCWYELPGIRRLFPEYADGRLGVSRLHTDEQQTFRTQSSQIRDVFGRWLTAACAAGVRFVVLEGLMRSGKSCLTEQPFAIGIKQSVNIELDGFLRKPVNPETKYMDAIDVDAASARIIEAYRTAPLVIAEGPMAWPIVQRVLQEEIPSDEVRRVYLKRMSSNYPDRWPDGEFLYESEPPGVYFQSISRYHATKRPWLLADLVIERIGRDEE